MIPFEHATKALTFKIGGLVVLWSAGWFASVIPIALAAQMLEPACNEHSHYFGIQVIDEETKRGVPLVRLRTTGNIDYWTDSQGWIAFCEPGLMDREVHFQIESPGYEYPADGFGIRGMALRTTPGTTRTLKLKRSQPAERLYRITGQGIYRDSELLELPIPELSSRDLGGVIGQDSVQMVPWKSGFFWLWGDTSLPHYPLGNFRVTAATSPGMQEGNWSPKDGIPLRYFLNPSTGLVKEMLPDPQPGVVWIWGLVNVPDEHGRSALAGHYARLRSMEDILEQGIALWDAEKEEFVKKATFAKEWTWQVPRGQAFVHEEETGTFVYFAEPFAHTRVRASLNTLIDPNQYESLAWDPASKEYRWQKSQPPTTQAQESSLIADGAIPDQSALYALHDQETGQPVLIHRASIRWNAFRAKWIMIGCEWNQTGRPSLLGEIWYAEADNVTGPWRKAIKVASHPRYTFYNPRQHDAFDEDGGKIIYFEGTYTQAFSGNPVATPRYDYNQLMYRLDLTRLLQGPSPGTP